MLKFKFKFNIFRDHEHELDSSALCVHDSKSLPFCTAQGLPDFLKLLRRCIQLVLRIVQVDEVIIFRVLDIELFVSSTWIASDLLNIKLSQLAEVKSFNYGIHPHEIANFFRDSCMGMI
jgi:hypothetical protein